MTGTPTIEITAFSWVPPFARGLVRELRIRWVLEELGIPYRTRLYNRATEGPETRIPEQPFGQVPAFVEGDVRMFESGAVCLYLAERSEALMPRDPLGRARTLTWSIAALNSVEPFAMQLSAALLFEKDQPWAAARLPVVEENVRGRLQRLSDDLGGKDWLEDRFTVADLLMVSVLRSLRDSDILSHFPNLAAYQARGEARPAFVRALDAQMADFAEAA